MHNAISLQSHGKRLLGMSQAFQTFATQLGLPAAADLLQPAHNTTLLNVLQYHIIPGTRFAPRPPEQLRHGDVLPTLLQNANLVVDLT